MLLFIHVAAGGLAIVLGAVAWLYGAGALILCNLSASNVNAYRQVG